MIARVSMGELAIRTIRLSVPLYVASLLLALGPALVGMLGLVSVAADRPWRTELLGPNWLNLLLELMGETIYSGGSLGVGVMVAAGLLVLPLVMLGQMIAYSFLAGGILERLSPGYAAYGTFWAGCRRWFWPSLWLSVLGNVIVVAVGLGVGFATGQVGRWISVDVLVLIQLAAQALVFGWLELARASMVRLSDRSLIRCLREAARAFLRPLVLLLWLALALPPAGLLLAAILPPATSDPYAVAALLMALVYGQLVAFLGAWTKVIRLAVAAYIAATAQPEKMSVVAQSDTGPIR